MAKNNIVPIFDRLVSVYQSAFDMAQDIFLEMIEIGDIRIIVLVDIDANQTVVCRKVLG